VSTTYAADGNGDSADGLTPWARKLFEERRYR
jgi:hypothetical protein